MSLELLKKLEGSEPGIITDFLDKANIGSRGPRIAWYPSAGDDFRALTYITEEYMVNYPGDIPDAQIPDLFLMTDYNRRVKLADGSPRILYEDGRTKIETWSGERLPDIQLPISSDIAVFPEPNGMVMFHYVRAVSDRIGLDTVVPVIYVGALNEEFCAEYLLKYDANVSHVMHIRYGGGCGGGGYAGGGWIPNVLQRLHTEVYITDGREATQKGDLAAMAKYPSLKKQRSEPALTPIRQQDRKYWSDYGDITWFKVDKQDTMPVNSNK